MHLVAQKGAVLIGQEIVPSEKLVVKCALVFRNPPPCYIAYSPTEMFFESAKLSLLKFMMYSVLLCEQIPLSFHSFLRHLLISSSFKQQLFVLHLANIIVPILF